MAIKIPLEDTYADILSKARRGLGLDLDTLSAKAGVPSALANQILSGSFDEPGALWLLCSTCILTASLRSEGLTIGPRKFRS